MVFVQISGNSNIDPSYFDHAITPPTPEDLEKTFNNVASPFLAAAKQLLTDINTSPTPSVARFQGDVAIFNNASTVVGDELATLQQQYPPTSVSPCSTYVTSLMSWFDNSSLVQTRTIGGILSERIPYIGKTVDKVPITLPLILESLPESSSFMNDLPPVPQP